MAQLNLMSAFRRRNWTKKSMVTVWLMRRVVPNERQEAGIMMIVVSVLVFTGALVAALTTIAMMVAPQWRRILHLATGHIEPAFTPLATLVVAERRIAVRRWAAGSPAPSLVRRRVAA
ncbi:hypothetical protein [uncultured Sphingomonas sp.]|uniref:hypothetical protein n=2 Tax=Sphingomonas TaxID=13687 RepID=UPI0025F905A7|nr:hypothetical protein [uncultured Sphingomonas sp.]